MQKTETELIEDVITDVEKRYAIILFNDDVNTFDHVIQSLVEICKHHPLQAEQCAIIVHNKGKANVSNGEFNEMAARCQALCDRGLSATVELIEG